MKALNEKMQKAKELYEKLVKNVNNDFVQEYTKETKEIQTPNFI